MTVIRTKTRTAPKRLPPGNATPDEYMEFMRDKRCVMVGPAGYLEGKGMGEWIDSHDVVIRLNWGVPSPEHAEQQARDIGTRCDVLYKRLLKLGQLDFIDINDFIAAGVKWVLATDAPNNVLHLKHLRRMLGDGVKWYVENDTKRSIHHDLGNSPLIGTVAIKHLLTTPLKSLVITGCDFYLSEYYQHYGGRDYRESMQRKEGTIGPTHDPGTQLRYWNSLAMEDSRLTFDETLATISKNVNFVNSRLTANAIVIIPARYESSRFPGKPLALIKGEPMIIHVCRRVSVLGLKAYVATDDKRIADVVEAAGFKAVMTRDALTGTDRVAEASKLASNLQMIINIQGDEPLVDPLAIIALIEAKSKSKHEVIGAIAPLQPGEAEDVNVVKVALKHGKHQLAYASRAAIPHGKQGDQAMWKQVGIYAFNKRELEMFTRLGGRSTLEAAEDIEILRFLELGMPVRMIQVPAPGPSVDLPEHIVKVEALM